MAVYDADFFDDIFDGMVEANDEGELDSEQFIFDEATVRRLFANGDLAPSGAACLNLAWKSRGAIL